MRIAVVAPSCTLKRETAAAVEAIVAGRGDCELVIHPQSFLSDGHFAGPDQARLAALREVMPLGPWTQCGSRGAASGPTRSPGPLLATWPTPPGPRTILGLASRGSFRPRS